MPRFSIRALYLFLTASQMGVSSENYSLLLQGKLDSSNRRLAFTSSVSVEHPLELAVARLIWALIVRCWHDDCNLRLSASHVVKVLGEALSALKLLASRPAQADCSDLIESVSSLQRRLVYYCLLLATSELFINFLCCS